MRKREEGQSTVEFALVLPILILVVCGIIDFGWLFFNQLSLENGCREGARYACVNSTEENLEEKVKTKVIEHLPTNQKGATTVTTQFTNAAAPTDGDVKVTVKSKIKTLTPVLGTVYGDTKTATYTLTMKVES